MLSASLLSLCITLIRVKEFPPSVSLHTLTRWTPTPQRPAHTNTANRPAVFVLPTFLASYCWATVTFIRLAHMAVWHHYIWLPSPMLRVSTWCQTGLCSPVLRRLLFPLFSFLHKSDWSKGCASRCVGAVSLSAWVVGDVCGMCLQTLPHHASTEVTRSPSLDLHRHLLMPAMWCDPSPATWQLAI